MMNKQIRRMIDEIFADMKMTADNLALRDEMMANAQARFEDSVRAGKTEEEAFAEVAASLGDVQSLLHDMNAEKPGEDKEDKEEKTEEKAAKAEADEAPDFEVRTEKTPDIGDVLGKAFGALGDVGKQIVPQAQKLVRQVDDLTGGMIGGIGKAVDSLWLLVEEVEGDALGAFGPDSGETSELVDEVLDGSFVHYLSSKSVAPRVSCRRSMAMSTALRWSRFCWVGSAASANISARASSSLEPLSSVCPLGT